MKHKPFPFKSLIIIFALSLIVRTATASLQHHPQTMDEAYSYVNAVTLVEGGGFNENYIWQYLTPPQGLPQPSHLYWMPLTSIIAVLGLWLGGISYDAAQWGFIILAALLPPLGYLMTWQVSSQARHAWVVALMMLFSGLYFWFWTVTDNFTPFAFAGALSLYASWRTIEVRVWHWAILAGLTAGLAHLARADGPLLLVASGLVLMIYTLAGNNDLSRKSGIQLLCFIGIGYLLVLMPWFIRNMQAIGMPMAAGGGKTLWLQNYNDLFSYQRDLSWRSYLAWGWSAIFQSKMTAFGINFQRILGEIGLIFALPLAIIGYWQRRTHPLFQIATLYFGLLFGAMTFAFTYPGIRGALFHSGGALLPFVALAAVIGLDTLIEVVAPKRSTWRVTSAKVVFSGGLVALALLITGFGLSRHLPQTVPLHQVYSDIIATLPDTAVVMVGNPPAFIYHGGYQAIAIPAEPINIVLDVADRYEASYLVLDKNHPHTLAPYFSGETAHPRLHLISIFVGPTYLYQILGQVTDRTQPAAGLLPG